MSSDWFHAAVTRYGDRILLGEFSIRKLAQEAGLSFYRARRVMTHMKALDRVGPSWEEDQLERVTPIATSGEPKVTKTGTPDDLAVIVDSSTVRTLEELLEVAEVDPAEWRVVRWRANKWDQASKRGDTSIQVVELWQVRADFERRATDGIKGVSNPRVLAHPRNTRTRNHDLEIVVVVPDAQIGHRWDRTHQALKPMHDRRALDVVVQAIEILQPDRVVNQGDFLDLAPWSRHRRPMDIRDTTTPQLREAHWWQSEFVRAAPDADQDYLEGNHEARINKALTDNMPEATTTIPVGHVRPLASIETLLALDSLGVKYHGPYGSRMWLWDIVEMTHGDTVRSGAGKTVASLSERSLHSVWVGHIHKREQATRTVWGPDGPKSVTASSCGCLCLLGQEDVPGYEGRREWQQGFGIIIYDKKTGMDHHIVVPIEDGRAWLNGSMIEARDRLKEIAAFVGYSQILNG